MFLLWGRVDMASYEIFMEDEVEIGRWVFKETKKVHLALDPHSSSYNQIGIKHIIQNIGSSRHIHLANSNNVSDALCIIYGHDNRLRIGTRVCDIFGRDWSPSTNGRRIYQIVCYKMIPNYYPFSINFIFSTYYPIKHSKYTHPGGVWLAKKTTAGASCVVEKTLKDTYFARLCT